MSIETNVAGEPAIRIANLTRRFGGTTALDNVTLEVGRGGVLGLVGANGAGKTTLIKHVLGLLRAVQGTVRVFGLDPVADVVPVLGRLGYLSEDRDLPLWMTVGEVMRYRQAFYREWDPAYAEELRERFHLAARARLRDLSRGELAKAGLLVALAHRPDLVVLDEPSSGLDPVVRRELLEAIVRTVADEGRTVLFSSHLLDEIARVSDRVAMLARGRLVLEGETHRILEAHRRCVVRWSGERETLRKRPAVLEVRGGPEEWTVIGNGGTDAFFHGLRMAGAEVVEEGPASFEEVFHAHAAEPI
jgi:ABC-2 type transport system ATP-binding protein